MLTLLVVRFLEYNLFMYKPETLHYLHVWPAFSTIQFECILSSEMCLSSMQEDGTSHSWNLASKDKCSSVIFDRLLYYRVLIFVQISRNKLGQK